MRKKKDTADLDKTWSYGDWLERYLAKDVKLVDLKELAVEATDLLEIDFSFKDNEVSFHYIERMEKDAMGDESIFDNWEQAVCQFSPEVTNSEPDPYGEFLRVMEVYDERDPYEPNPPQPKFENLIYYAPIASSTIRKINDFRKTIVWILKEILKANKPWAYTMYDFGKHELWGHQVEFLIKAEMEITKNWAFTDGRLSRQNTFFYAEIKNRYNLFKWDAVIARIFFAFLEAGGQDYFGFCKRCDKFFIIQRKGRKTYCGKICRTRASQERMAL